MMSRQEVQGIASVIGTVDDDSDWEERDDDRDALLFHLKKIGKVIAATKPIPPSFLEVPKFGVSMKNIPNDIPKEKIVIQLKSDFPEVFDHSDIKLVKYTNPKGDQGRQHSIAVVSGARGTLRQLQRNSIGKGLRHGFTTFDFSFLPDFGVPRDEFGRRKNPVSGTAFHTIKEREGPLQRTGIFLFTKEFRQRIPESILNYLGPSTLFIRHPRVVDSDLKECGLFALQRPNKYYADRRIVTGSQLEGIQLIRKMNSASVKGMVIIFQNENKDVESVCQDRTGLGKNGTLLTFDEYTHSVPLSWFDAKILNHKFIQSFELDCYRCQKPYNLVATSVNLDYLLASCCCTGRCQSYAEWNRHEVPINAPYHHPGEVHTRLSYCVVEKSEERLVAFPYLPKMDTNYPSAHFMSNVLLPVLEEEWRAERDDSHKQQCTGEIIEKEDLGTIDKNKERVILIVKVTESKFWRLAKSTGFKNVTICCKVRVIWKEPNPIDTTVNGDLRKAEKFNDCGKIFLRLFFEVEWERKYAILQNGVLLIPNADKSEYSFSRKYINSFPNLYIEQIRNNINSLSRFFIHNSPFHFYDESPAPFPSNIRKIVNTLKPAQRQALNTVMENPISIVQGPPGTGKSYLISAMAIALATTKTDSNPGVVLCTAASNIACNVMYRQIKKIKEQFGVEVDFCRVFSRGKELQMRREAVDHENSGEDSEMEEPMTALHNLVSADSRYLKGKKELCEIEKLINSGEEYKMTKSQRLLFQNHVAEIERKILNEQDIIVLTNGCLASYRLGKSKDEDDEEKAKIKQRPLDHVHSLLIDEAGVQTVTSTLPLETLKPSKFVIIGDHLQLQPKILSRSAAEAGLNRSLMEYLVVDTEDSEIPKTMLVEQIRAHADLRQLTSQLTYKGQLSDADEIWSRPEKIPFEFFDSFPFFKQNRILVRHHQGIEKQIESSKGNDTEAKIVVDTVKDFLSQGLLDQKDIVVLTPYDGQKSLIWSLLVQNKFENVQVKNVDEYQGSEATCIIVSFTRSNPERRLGFLMNENRVNVCVSRARELMVIVINLSMLEPFKNENSHLGKLFRFLNKSNVVEVPVDEDQKFVYAKTKYKKNRTYHN